MEVTYRFQLPKDEEKMDAFQNAPKRLRTLEAAVDQFQRDFRDIYKYADLTDAQHEVVTRIREHWFGAFEGVDWF